MQRQLLEVSGQTAEYAGKVQGSTRAQILRGRSGGVWPPNESVNSLMNGFCRECRAQWEATEPGNWIPGQEEGAAPDH